MSSTPQEPTSRHQSRPGRIAVVVDDLAALHGPTRGVVRLPHRLLWRADRSIDLGQHWQLAALYEIVLTEAVRVEELCTWLDGPTLLQLWPELYLPRGVRQAWQERHPMLRALPHAA